MSLTHLDLSQNFLRSLSADPLKSLNQLTSLLLHDNDISMIDDGALAMHKDLTRFTIEGKNNCVTLGFFLYRYIFIQHKKNRIILYNNITAIEAYWKNFENALQVCK